MVGNVESAFIKHIQKELEAKAKTFKEWDNECDKICEKDAFCQPEKLKEKCVFEFRLIRVDDVLAIIKKVLEAST